MSKRMSACQPMKTAIILIFTLTLTACNSMGKQNQQQGNSEKNPDFNPDTDIELTVVKTQMQLLPGNQTDVFTYHSKLISGDVNSLAELPGSYLGHIYKLAWNDGSDMLAIGTDGGLLSASFNKAYVLLAPGERIEVWKDFPDMESGSQLILKSLAFNSGAAMGMGGMTGGGMLRNYELVND